MLQDLRYSARTLLRTPGFALIAVLTLAIGIAANTAIFSVVNGVLLRPLPFPDPERIVNVWTATAQDRHDNHSAADFLDISRDNQSLSGIAGYRSAFFTVVGRTAEPARLEGTYVTVDFFDVLRTTAGGRPALLARDRRPGARKPGRSRRCGVAPAVRSQRRRGRRPGPRRRGRAYRRGCPAAPHRAPGRVARSGSCPPSRYRLLRSRRPRPVPIVTCATSPPSPG